MTDKVIAIEQEQGVFQQLLQRVMRMVPDRDRDDGNLRRLVAFRLKNDGEAATTEYLVAKIRDFIQCGAEGSLFSFLRGDLEDDSCSGADSRPDPPEIA
jgi:hypothetical protein